MTDTIFIKLVTYSSLVSLPWFENIVDTITGDFTLLAYSLFVSYIALPEKKLITPTGFYRMSTQQNLSEPSNMILCFCNL